MCSLCLDYVNIQMSTSWDSCWEHLYNVKGWEDGREIYKVAMWVVTIFTAFLLMGIIALISKINDACTTHLPITEWQDNGVMI